ncbi:galactose-3-O-sulfotransferase 2-like [Seriola dumerili]|uniref:Galactose-3-O-sulfotransferase 2 n=1 Tax=Seriola dumerili TaxID=41447 RepID=A0A3B4TZ46_SERDU|nr:galactose-3-O-sulfotransferase 2-like [Seriola dumerili]
MLLVLLLVCVAFQTFVTRSARTDKLTEPGPGPGLPDLRFTVNKQPSPSLQKVWEHWQNTRPLQTDRPDLHHQKGGHRKPSDNILLTHVDKILNPAAGSQLEEQLDPGPLVLRSTRNHLTAGPVERLVHSPTTSSDRTKISCHPKSHIVFLKTHKTASSTILNVLYRYGESRNLTFALPVNKHSQLFYPFFFASHFVEGVSSRRVKEFNIMCNHMRFRKSEVVKVMPDDTFYFSILRHPVSMMESIFIYYKSIPAFHKTRSLDDFLDNSWRTYNSSVTNNHYAHNILAFDFGFDNNAAADADDLEERASRAVAAIERDFHLVLISEYFDESMVLLRHALCWSLEDMVSFKLNSRSERTRHQLSADTPEKIRRWNALDWRIYLHFNATFWHKVDSLVGREQMKREVSQLRELQLKLANTCLKDGGAVDPSQIKDAGLKPFQYGAAVIQGYNLNPDLDPQTRTQCQRLITPELQYTERLYTQQFPELAAKLKHAPRKVPPQRQRSDRAAVMGGVWSSGGHHRPVIRHRVSNLINLKASTSGLLAHTAAHNKTGVP